MTARPRGQTGWVGIEGPSYVGFWHEYDVTGKRKRRQRKLGLVAEMTRTKAKREHAQWVMAREGQGPAAVVTMADLWAKHAERYKRTSGGQRATIASLWRKHLAPAFGAMRPESITGRDIEAFFDALETAGYAKSLRDKARETLRALLKRAVEDRLIQHSPMRDAYVRIPRDGAGVALTATEVRAIRAELAEEEDRIKFDLLWMLGIDRSALRALRRNDITEGGLRIDEGRVEGRATKLKTARRAAEVALPRDLAERLKPLADGSDKWLFPAFRGSGPFAADRWMAEVLRPAAVRAGVSKHVDFRMLRRTAGTLMQQAGAKPQAAAGVLRNSAEITMRHYTDINQRAEQLAAVEASWASVMNQGRVM